MSEEDNIRKIEAQKQVERKDSNSNVKTPLVDALRTYFWQESYDKYGTKTILTNIPVDKS